MKFKHVEKGTKDENWHVHWKTKKREFKVAIFKMTHPIFWEWRASYDFWHKIFWIVSRFMFVMNSGGEMQARICFFSFGWRTLHVSR